ncbi:MAG TPA: hypothetical protein VH141_11370 [Pseudonocardia sp.]|nr:hypothetical protein [Pseudonocardia sp.]
MHDTWHTTGLRGSASNDYSVDDVWVPADHTFVLGESHRDEPLYRWPGAFLTNYLGVPLGVAADVLDTAMGILDGKVLMPEGIRARGDAKVRLAVARAQALVGSAAIRQGSPPERNVRDLITIGQHFMSKSGMREWAGGLWFGQPAPLPLL